jgi:S1/P1 Nuclease
MDGKMKSKLIVVLMVVFFAGGWKPARAWNATGHMVVAQIAQDRLSQAAQAKCMDLLVIQALPTEPRTPAALFLSAACSADDSKNPADVELHFISLPFTTDGTTPRLPKTRSNIVDAIMDCVKTLENPAAPKLERATKLRLLLNLVGDIHQPLRCATRCNQNEPHGDKNGHNFMLGGGVTLRGFWDNGAGLLKTVVTRPLTAEGIAKIAHLKQQITAACPADAMDDELEEKSPRKWAEDSLEVAKGYAYGISPNEEPSAEYIYQSQEQIKRRLALAGYRLAALLNDLFDKK